MNINFHYFTIRIISEYMGFSPVQSQRIAFFSQFVDDYLYVGKFPLETTIADYFIRNGLCTKDSGGRLWVESTPTGISMKDTILGPHDYYEKVVIPFHFIPDKSLNVLGEPRNLSSKDKDRIKYRCKRYILQQACLFDEMIRMFYYKNDDNYKSFPDGWLMQLGILLHVYADTYAHEGFSGGWGWENFAYLEQVTKDGKPENLLQIYTREACHQAPSIGHANAGHLPDAGALSYKLRRPENPADGEYRVSTFCSNPTKFSECYKSILSFFELMMSQCRIAVRGFDRAGVYDKILSAYADSVTYASPTSPTDLGESEDMGLLYKIWRTNFPEIHFEYNKDSVCQYPMKPTYDFLLFNAYAHMFRESVLRGVDFENRIRFGPRVG